MHNGFALPARLLSASQRRAVPTGTSLRGSHESRVASAQQMYSISHTKPQLRRTRRCSNVDRAFRFLHETTPTCSVPPAMQATAAVEGEVEIKPEKDVIVVSVTAAEGTNLLMALTGVFSALDMKVLSASIRTTNDNMALDEFRVVMRDGSQVPKELWSSLESDIHKVLKSTSQSMLPAIYGMAAAAEVKRLRPKLPIASEGGAAQLELAAAEMAQAAATLVQLERELIALAEDGATDASVVTTREQARQEAAALLERRMAAMEAALAARRAPANAAAAEAAEKPQLELAVDAAGDQMPAHTSTGPGAGSGRELILQGFNWESCKSDWYNILTAQAAELEKAGFTAVWLPPPSDAVSPQGYLPRDLYKLDSEYGSEAELRNCITQLKAHNMKVVADIVINHRCAHYQDDHGRWNRFGGRLAWDESVICCNNPEYAGRGHHKTGEDYTAAPNIDHTNELVQRDLTEWLQHLKKVGFDGWRFDFVKGYHGRFAKLYVDATVPEMAFGEFWDTCSYTDCVLNYNQDDHRQRTVDWIDQTDHRRGFLSANSVSASNAALQRHMISAVNAAYHFTQEEACARSEYWRLVDGKGRPPGLIGMWPSRAVTFIENHDTGSTLNHWPFPWNHLHEGYAYILTHPGTPCVFYDHFWQEHGGLGTSIRELLAARRQAGIHGRSEVTVRRATADVYACTVDGKLAMKIGYGEYSPNRDTTIQCGVDRWTCTVSGPNFAVWLDDKIIRRDS